MILVFHPDGSQLILLLLVLIFCLLLVLAIVGWLIWSFVELNRWNARKKDKLNKEISQKKSE